MAYIITCFIGGDMHGACTRSLEQFECRPAMREVFDWAEQIGQEVYVICEYTTAPVESIRPMERPDV